MSSSVELPNASINSGRIANEIGVFGFASRVEIASVITERVLGLIWVVESGCKLTGASSVPMSAISKFSLGSGLVTSCGSRSTKVTIWLVTDLSSCNPILIGYKPLADICKASLVRTPISIGIAISTRPVATSRRLLTFTMTVSTVDGNLPDDASRTSWRVSTGRYDVMTKFVEAVDVGSRPLKATLKRICELSIPATY